MKLSAKNQRTLLVAIHQSIEKRAVYYAKNLLEGQTKEPSYPSNSGFTIEEKEALKILQGNKALPSAMRKILSSCAASPVSDLFSYIDGVTDPNHGDWGRVVLVDKSADVEEKEEFLHDEFYATYWDCRKIRPDKTWYLDIFPE